MVLSSPMQQKEVHQVGMTPTKADTTTHYKPEMKQQIHNGAGSDNQTKQFTNANRSSYGW